MQQVYLGKAILPQEVDKWSRSRIQILRDQWYGELL